MTDQKSTLNWSDCRFLIKKMQESIMKLHDFAASGCPKTGLGGDFMTKVSLIDLKQQIETILAKGKTEV